MAVGCEGAEDLAGGFGPDEWLGIVVPFVDPGAHVAFEFDEAAVGGAAQFAVGQFSKPALNEVKPGGRGGSEVQLEAGVAQQPVPCQNSTYWG